MLERLVILSLCYSQIFNSTYSQKELLKWLVIQKTTFQELDQILKKLENQKKIIHKNNQYGLKTTADFSSHTKIYSQKLQNAEKAANLLKIIPTIKLIAVSGSLAAGKPQKNSDIDLFIVCSPDSVWLSRFFSVLILRLFHLQRKRENHNNIQVKNSVCLNMFLDINKLRIKNENIYSAREILQIIPIINRGQVYEKFLHANIWTSKIFPNFVFPPQPQNKTFPESHIFSKLLSIPLFWVQYQYMRSHITNETVNSNEIRFHPIDYQSIILKKYQSTISQTKTKLKEKERKLIFGNSLDKKN